MPLSPVLHTGPGTGNRDTAVMSSSHPEAGVCHHSGGRDFKLLNKAPKSWQPFKFSRKVPVDAAACLAVPGLAACGATDSDGPATRRRRGRRSYSYSSDTGEGPRAPAVKLTARHSSLTRVRAAPLSPWWDWTRSRTPNKVRSKTA